MKRTLLFCLAMWSVAQVTSQSLMDQADSLKAQGLLMPALEKYGMAFGQQQSPEISYKMAGTCALLWTKQMRDTAFFFLRYALQDNYSLEPLHDPDFLSLIEDPRWTSIEDIQMSKYESVNGSIKNKTFARELFRMIIRDQGFMYAGNIERRKYMQNGGYFSTPAIFPVLAMEEKNLQENQKRLFGLLDQYGWPTASEVTEYAAAGAALIINHAAYEDRVKYFPMLEEAFNQGEAQPLRYAKMKDRLLIEEGKQQLYGTQYTFERAERVPLPIHEPQYVDQRRAEIGLEPLVVYLKERFGIEWNVPQQSH
ncbi:DUF6624 domain-containing protein [Marinoscillum sp.]|uniref:DUF6624 domain-containing protein n=1 Tax=Marinoscillum sp. TaxID=2024838 RepID=UPI003BA8AC01